MSHWKFRKASKMSEFVFGFWRYKGYFSHWFMNIRMQYRSSTGYLGSRQSNIHHLPKHLFHVVMDSSNN